MIKPRNEVQINIVAMGGLRIRVNKFPNGGCVSLHTAGTKWFDDRYVTIEINDPRELAAWQTLANTLAALDVKEPA